MCRGPSRTAALLRVATHQVERCARLQHVEAAAAVDAQRVHEIGGGLNVAHRGRSLVEVLNGHAVRSQRDVQQVAGAPHEGFTIHDRLTTAIDEEDYRTTLK